MYKLTNSFKKEIVYIRVFENKIELRHLDSGRTVVRNSKEPFSNDRLLIANITNATNFISEILKEVRKETFFPALLVVLIQPMEKVDGGISEVEQMIFRDLILQIGGRVAFIHPKLNHLTDEEVRLIVK